MTLPDKTTFLKGRSDAGLDFESQATQSKTTSKRELNKQAMRGKIYEVAMALFKEEGFAAVTVAQICENAGVARATFFAYFPQKSALILEFGNRIAQEARQELQLSLQSVQQEGGDEQCSAKQILVQLTEIIFKHWDANSSVLKVMMREFMAQANLMDVSSSDHFDFYFLFVEIIRLGQKQNEFRTDIAAEISAFSLLSSCANLAAAWSYFDEAFDYKYVSTQQLSLFFHGLELQNR